MPYYDPFYYLYTQDGAKASYIPVQSGQTVVVSNSGNTLYYDNASSVTSSSNDGNIASGASAEFTSPQYVICATGVSTQVQVQGLEAYSAISSPTQSSTVLSASAGPYSGTAVLGGTGAGSVDAGALFVNTTTGNLYINEGSTASPYWTPINFQQTNLLGVYEDFRSIAEELLYGGAVAITDTGTVGRLASGARIGGLGLAEADSGIAPGTMVAGSHVARITATAADAKGVFLGGDVVAQYKPANAGPMCVDVELTSVTNIADRSLFVGFVSALADNAAPPVVGATVTLTLGPNEVTGIALDTGMTDSDALFLANEKANAAGTQTTLTNSGTLPVAATYTRLRTEIRPDGSAVGFQDKAAIGLIPGASGAGAHTSAIAAVTTTALIPAMFFGSKTAATKIIDVKRYAHWGTRS